MPALIALGCSVTLTSAAGSRELPLESLYHDYQVNDIAPGEFIERIRVPRLADNQHFRTYKLSKRFDQDISAVCAAFRLTIVNDEIIAARAAFGGVAGTPSRASGCEQAMTNQAFNENTLNRAMLALEDDFSPLSDMRASADYRSAATKNLLKRCFIEIGQPDVATDVYNFGR